MEFITCRSLQTVTSPRPVHLADPGTWRRVCRAERSEHPPGGGAPVPQPLSAIASSTASPAAHTSGEEAALSGSQLGIPANSPFLPDYGAHSRTKVRLGLRASQMSGLRRGSWLMTQPEVELSGRRPRASARLSRQGRQPHCLPLPASRLPRLRSAEGTSPGSPAEEPSWKRGLGLETVCQHRLAPGTFSSPERPEDRAPRAPRPLAPPGNPVTRPR